MELCWTSRDEDSLVQVGQATSLTDEKGLDWS